jgi:6-phosphogluconolactonase
MMKILGRCILSALAVGFAFGGAGTSKGTDPFLLAQKSGQAPADELRVYIGTYAQGNGKGIYLAHLDLATGRLKLDAGVAAELTNPSFLVMHPNRPLLYAVSETDSFGGNSGAVGALRIDPKTGRLSLLNQKPSGGAGPCHLAVDPSGKFVLTANYSGGSVACLPIGEDGRLGDASAFAEHKGSGANRRRQEGPHAHCVAFDAAGRFAFAADLGIDKIMVYRFDPAAGKLAAGDPPSVATAAGAGPRHLAFQPGGRFAYLINELDSTMTAFRYDARRGALAPLQTVSTLPEGFRGSNTGAEVQVHPNGRFVYGSNRGHDSIAAFAIEPESGKLRYIAHESTQGKTPRNFAVDPTGRYLLAANQDSDNVVVFHIDQTTGKLRPAGSSIRVPSPVCVLPDAGAWAPEKE